MPSSQSLLLRNSKGQFRKGHAPITANPSAPKQRKKKRKLDLTPTLKHLHLSEHDVGVRRSQRIKHQTHRKKKPKLDLTPSKYFRSKNDVPVLRRSQRIKCQKQEAKSLKKTKCIKRRKRKRQKSSLSSISKHNNSSQSNYQKKATETLSKAKLINLEYRCVLCNQRFPMDVNHYCSQELAMQHFLCFDKECDFKSDCFDEFKQHMSECHRMYRFLYKCPHCGKRYEHNHQLKYHENTHLNNGRFECCLCKQRHPVLSKLRVHDCEKAKKSEQQHVEDVDHNEPKPLRRPRRNRKRKRSMMENDSASHKGQDEKERDDADTDNRLLCKEKSEEQKEMDIDNRKKSEEQEQEVVDEAVTDNRLLYKEKLELEVYIQTHRQLGNIKCENEAEYRGKLDVLIKKQSELEAMDWKQRELMPIKFQINQRFLDSINTIKSKLNK
eukprot:283407_1